MSTISSNIYPGPDDSSSSLSKFLFDFGSDTDLLTKSGESSFNAAGLDAMLEEVSGYATDLNFNLLNDKGDDLSRLNLGLNNEHPRSPASDVGSVMEVPHTPENLTDSETESKYEPEDIWRSISLPVACTGTRKNEAAKRKHDDDDDDIDSDDSVETMGGDSKRRTKLLPPGIILPSVKAYDYKITAVFFKLQDSQGKADTKQSGKFKSTANVQHFIRASRVLINSFPKSQPARVALIGDQCGGMTTNGHPNLVVTWASQNNKYGKPYKDGKVAVWTVGTDKFPPKEYAFVRLDGTEFTHEERAATAAPCFDESNQYLTHDIPADRMLYIGPLCLCGEFLAKSLGGKYCGECDGKYRNFHSLLDKFSTSDRRQHVSDVLDCFTAEEKARHVQEFLMKNPDVAGMLFGNSQATNTTSQLSHGSIILEFVSVVNVGGKIKKGNYDEHFTKLLLQVVKDHFENSSYGLKYANVARALTDSVSTTASSSSTPTTRTLSTSSSSSSSVSTSTSTPTSTPTTRATSAPSLSTPPPPPPATTVPFAFKLCFNKIDDEEADFNSEQHKDVIANLNQTSLVSTWVTEARARETTHTIDTDTLLSLSSKLSQDQQRKLWLHLIEAAAATGSPNFAHAATSSADDVPETYHVDVVDVDVAVDVDVDVVDDDDDDVINGGDDDNGVNSGAGNVVDVGVGDVTDESTTSSSTSGTVNGCWSLFSTIVTIENSQFVPHKCSGGHYDHSQYRVSETFPQRVLKVVGGKGSKWPAELHQFWSVRSSDGAMEVRNKNETNVAHLWEPVTPTTSTTTTTTSATTTASSSSPTPTSACTMTGTDVIVTTQNGETLGYNRKTPRTKTPFGLVFEGKFGAPSVKVVVKEINNVKVDALVFQKFFDAKMTTQKQIDCEYIVKMLLTTTVNIQSASKRLVVLEYCNGGNLAQHLTHTGPMVDDDVIDIFHDLSSALTYLSGIGSMHGDIKESSILLHRSAPSDRTVYKLSDVGQSRYAATALYGSPRMFAPEVVHRQTSVLCGIEADLWSFGAVLYKCLTCKDLRDGGAVTDVIGAMRTWQWEDDMLNRVESTRVSSALKTAMGPILGQLLQHNPAQRRSYDSPHSQSTFAAFMQRLLKCMQVAAATSYNQQQQQQQQQHQQQQQQQQALKREPVIEPDDSAIGSSMVSNESVIISASQVQRHEAELSEARQVIELQRRQLTQREALVTTQQNEITTHENEITNQQNEITNQQNEITNQQNEIGSLQVSLDTSKGEHMRKGLQIKDLTDQVAQLRTQVQRVTSANAVAGTKITELEQVTRLYELEGNQELADVRQQLEMLPSELGKNLVTGRAQCNDLVILQRRPDRTWKVANSDSELTLSLDYDCPEILRDQQHTHVLGRVIERFADNTVIVEAFDALTLEPSTPTPAPTQTYPPPMSYPPPNSA